MPVRFTHAIARPSGVNCGGTLSQVCAAEFQYQFVSTRPRNCTGIANESSTDASANLSRFSHEFVVQHLLRKG